MLRSKEELPTLAQNQNLVDRCQRAWTVGDYDGDAATGPHTQDRRSQRLLPFVIEIGVGFIKHDEERITIKRARKRHTLPLTGRKRAPGLADWGVITLRHRYD